MGYSFMVPEKILSGTGVIEELGQHIQGKGTKALIVTDAFMVKFGNAAKVEDALKKADIPYVLFDGANSEPTDKIVDAGLKVCAVCGVASDSKFCPECGAPMGE